jgi:hypothetical protein
MAQVDDSQRVNALGYMLLNKVQYRLLLKFSHQGAEFRLVVCYRHLIITV